MNYENEPMKVIEYRSSTDIDVQFQDDYLGVVTTTWNAFQSGHVKNPNQRETGIVHHPPGWVDLTGKAFNNLEVLYWDTNPPVTEKVKDGFTGLWKCRCLICGNNAWATGDQLKRGNRKSCRECGLKAKSRRKKSNKYDLSGEFGIGFTYDTGKIFYFDKEDFDLIKDYSWGENTDGYIVSIKKNKEVLMHRLVLGLERSDGKVVDHINHNVWDNRKSMLRITTTAENVRNHSIAKNNKSGKTGVRFDEESGLWEAYIWHGRNRRLGKYKTIEEAIDARLEAEDKYFGEYSYDNSLRMGDKNEREMF